MFQPDPNQWPMGVSHTILPPHFVGGVAPSRHEVALAAYVEKQAVQRAAIVAKQTNPKNTQRLWANLFLAARRVARAVWQPQHSRRLRSALK
jgi:hypothetical protein